MIAMLHRGGGGGSGWCWCVGVCRALSPSHTSINSLKRFAILKRSHKPILKRNLHKPLLLPLPTIISKHTLSPLRWREHLKMLTLGQAPEETGSKSLVSLHLEGIFFTKQIHYCKYMTENQYMANCVGRIKC